MGYEKKKRKSGESIFSKIESLDKEVQWQFLSKWRFGQVFDTLAKLLQDDLSKKLNVGLGCSFLYKSEGQKYYLGGSSSERLKMSRSARYYDLEKESNGKSFAG